MFLIPKLFRRRTNTTPHLRPSKLAGNCTNIACGKLIQSGDQVMYYPQSRLIVCRDCATRSQPCPTV